MSMNMQGKILAHAASWALGLWLGGAAYSAQAETVTSVTQYGYDAVGRQICSTVRMNPATFGSPPASACALGTPGSDGPDRITVTEYDAANRVVDIVSGYLTNAQRIEKVVTYTANGQEATVADGKGNLTTYSYDGFDRLSAVRYPNAVCCTSSTSDYDAYDYDAAGNRTVWRKRDGQMVHFTYDALNRMTYHDGVPTWVYYDNLDRPTYTYAGANAEKIIAHYYDGLGRPSYTYDYRDGTWFPTYNGYDLAGRRTTLQWSDGNFVNYDYNAAGDMVGVRENGASSYLASLGYDNLGRRTHLLRGNGVITWYEYDNASRLNGLHHDVAGTDQSWIFTHNAASQLKTQASYNSAYNWTPGPAASRSYAINGLNQATTAGASTLAYDGRGNLISDGATGFAYDGDNRLTSAWGASNATLSYDPLGRLGQTNGAVSTRFAYSGADLIAELSTGNAVLRRYVPGPGTDEPLVWYEGPGMTDRRWLLPDAQGSIVAVTNASGAVTNINTYDEYGLPAASNVGRFQYTGQTWISELGLYNYKARMYSPTLGRFLQTDPIGYGDGLNWYAYVGNDPLNRSDPTGMWLQDDGSQGGYLLGGPDGGGSGYSNKPLNRDLATQKADFAKSQEENMPEVNRQLVIGGGAIVLTGVTGGLANVALASGGATAAATAGDITAETSMLGRASSAANSAATRADQFVLGAKHAANAGGRWAQFAEGVNPNAMLRAALRSPNARFLANDAESFKVVTDLGRVVGSKGQTGVRAVVDYLGHVVTWFPVKP